MESLKCIALTWTIYYIGKQSVFIESMNIYGNSLICKYADVLFSKYFPNCKLQAFKLLQGPVICLSFPIPLDGPRLGKVSKFCSCNTYLLPFCCIDIFILKLIDRYEPSINNICRGWRLPCNLNISKDTTWAGV